jgi:excisionase family DNA binding protein
MADIDHDPDRMLTVAMVAKRLCTCERTVHRKIKTGELRAYKLGRLVRVSETDLALFLRTTRRDAR